jgi:Zn-dependent M16 (insulinase) family peptidase
MKGVYQSGENVFHQYILDRALADTEYAHMYGGDPKQIPTLRH